MNIGNILRGTSKIRMVSADPEGTLRAFFDAGLTIQNAVLADTLTLEFTVRRNETGTMMKIAERKGCNITVLENKGVPAILKESVKRPVLIAGLLFLLILDSWLPTRIFFFRVEGNETIPSREILEKANACGISFGASRRLVRSEKMKNALLGAIPNLQWAGINTEGCVAVISVRERTDRDEKLNDNGGVSSIVASRDGVIQHCTVTKGSAACVVGQAVTKGQLLISGYTDCGSTITATHAEGEVFALTKRQLRVSGIPDYQKRGAKNHIRKKYSMIIGKNRINFYKGSGILDAGCVKMYEENFVTLPGGFRLPVAFVTEITTDYEKASCKISEEESEALLSQFAEHYLLDRMAAGKILGKQEALSIEAGSPLLTGSYACLEMIGVQRSEEILTPNE